jgi:hypothetical protein
VNLYPGVWRRRAAGGPEGFRYVTHVEVMIRVDGAPSGALSLADDGLRG